MSRFSNQLKSEIARIAKKEVRAETKLPTQASAKYRTGITALKRKMASLEAAIKKLDSVAVISSA